jgi:hypothetical protein
VTVREFAQPFFALLNRLVAQLLAVDVQHNDDQVGKLKLLIHE